MDPVKSGAGGLRKGPGSMKQGRKCVWPGTWHYPVRECSEGCCGTGKHKPDPGSTEAAFWGIPQRVLAELEGWTSTC